MTHEDRMELLRRAVAQEGSQAKVARRIGYSAGAVCAALKGAYGASLAALLTRVEEEYSDRTRTCPVLGEISFGRCAEERRTPFSASNPLRVKIYRACRNCPFNKG
ncbi:MAG: XRE family transcriptional regulator [Thermodesulfobacteriota bacterium]